MYQQIARNKRKSVLVIICFLLLWIGIGGVAGWLFSSKFELGSDGFTHRVHDVNAAYTGMVIAGLLAAGAAMWAVTSGHKLVLSASGAVPADPVQFQQLHNIVETLAIGDGLPKPDVYVINDPSPNAFATGTSPKKAAITATTGLLQMMNREELEGVIGHEMSHIKNYDVRLILIVSTLIGFAGVIASLVWRSAFYSSWDDDSREGNGGAILMVVGLLMILVSVIVGPLIQLALSRSRESLADASSVELTRNPVGLINALRKLQSNDRPFAKFNHVTAAMCIDDPLQHHQSWFHHLYDTHPPLEQRIAVLERIATGQSV